MRFSRSTVVSALLGLILVPAAAACSSGTSDASGASGQSTSAATPESGVVTTDPAHRPANNPDDVKVLEGITVTGDDPAVTPKVTFGTLPVSVSATTVRTLKEGTGDESVAGDKVTVRQALFLGKDGKQLDSNWDAKDTGSFLLSGSNTIPGLVTALTGVKAESRILFAIPPAEAFGSGGRAAAGVAGTDNLVVVADVVSVTTPLTQATGTPVPPVEGQPTVTFDPTTGPTITVPKTDPPTTLVSQNLVDGTGAAVASGQQVTVQYTGVVWADGSVFDSSWAKKAPFTFPIEGGQVIPGWDKGLVGKKVGSRVLLVVPPADGYGASAQGSIPANSTLVFVVDILDAS